MSKKTAIIKPVKEVIGHLGVPALPHVVRELRKELNLAKESTAQEKLTINNRYVIFNQLQMKSVQPNQWNGLLGLIVVQHVEGDLRKGTRFVMESNAQDRN